MNQGRAPRLLETVALTALALIAFAANSILTRMALAPGHIDAATFTAVRLVTGALALAALVRLQSGTWSGLRGRPGPGALALFAYAAPFTFAYLRIGAAVGALVLFGAVQLTMIGWGVVRGERPGLRLWAGLALAAGGLVALLLPSARRPDPVGLGLMIVAGVAWGAYSLLGKRVGDPLAASARGFLWSVPLALALYGCHRGRARGRWARAGAGHGVGGDHLRARVRHLVPGAAGADRQPGGHPAAERAGAGGRGGRGAAGGAGRYPFALGGGRGAGRGGPGANRSDSRGKVIREAR